MAFLSILFNYTAETPPDDDLKVNPPGYFADFNLGQVVDAVTRVKEEYNLKPFFYNPLHSVNEIIYRQRIFKEIENLAVNEAIRNFASQLQKSRKHHAQEKKLSYKHQKESWFLNAVEIYCLAVIGFYNDLKTLELQSEGLAGFREYLENYTGSESFNALLNEVKKIKYGLSKVQYSILINDNRVQVRNFHSEPDYSAEIAETFARFRQGAVKTYLAVPQHSTEMNTLEEMILERVVKLNPEIFAELGAFCEKNSNYADAIILRFDREIQFYISWHDFMNRFLNSGLQFCYPVVSSSSKEISNSGGFDLALANQLISENSPVVVNDFFLEGDERVLVVSGPNQGGKTTFARTFGQVHYFACLGCPVPGNSARLFLFDNLFAHFEREENIKNLQGKLNEELVRIHEILEQATPNSIVVINEIFNSTSLQDQIFLSKNIMEKITALDLLSVWVTFIDELSLFSKKTVSMVSTVNPENPAQRTFRIERKPADGLAFALSIAEKYRLSYEYLTERLKNNPKET